MYAVANIILGTHLPWDRKEAQAVLVALVEADPSAFSEEGESHTDTIEAAKQGAFELADAFDGEPWHHEYHGGADSPVAWIGVQLGGFDESDHLPLGQITGLVPTDEQTREARAAYDALPESVRSLLPPFGLYIVWGSS